MQIVVTSVVRDIRWFLLCDLICVFQLAVSPHGYKNLFLRGKQVSYITMNYGTPKGQGTQIDIPYIHGIKISRGNEQEKDIYESSLGGQKLFLKVWETLL